MSDDERPQSSTNETSDDWVTLGGYWSSRRVPGIDEVQETTYVAPPNRIPRRTLIIGSAIALASIAIGAGLVFAAGEKGGGDAGNSELSAAVTLTSSTTVPSTTTSTTAPPTTTTTVDQSTTTTQAASSSAAQPASTAELPRATADPSLPPYEPVPLPNGVTATLTPGSCRWVTTNGGELQASGTITSTSPVGHTWNMTMHWLQNSRTLNEASGLMDLQPHEGKPWSLTISQPNPPADLACSLAVS